MFALSLTGKKSLHQSEECIKKIAWFHESSDFFWYSKDSLSFELGIIDSELGLMIFLWDTCKSQAGTH